MLTPEVIERLRRVLNKAIEDDHAEIDALCDLALRGLNAGDQWRTMESAPKDGTRFLAAGQMAWGLVNVVKWRSGGWHSGFIIPYPLTHWQPLPAPPAMKEQS